MTWQPIETAPKDWTHVLVATEVGEVCEAYWHGGVGEWFYANLGGDDEAAIVDEVTHWMPLPDPPK